MSRILIIGGGVAGLSAGIHAQLKGHDAVICERHAVPGGCLSAWERAGHHIDNCIHWLTGTNPVTDLYKTWCELGVLGSIEVYPKESLYVYSEGDQHLALNRDIDILKADMLRISPPDAGETEQLLRAVAAVQGLSGVAGREHNEKIGGLELMNSLPTLLKYYRLSVGELAERFRSPLIRGFLTGFLPKDFGAFSLIFVMANFCGGNSDVPVGGSTGMENRMTARFKSLGGTLLTRKKAVKVRPERNTASVAFEDGTELSGDYVVITADPATVFGTLLDVKMPGPLIRAYRRLSRFSAYQCAFSCDLPALPFSGDHVIPLKGRYAEALHSDRLIVRNDDHEKSYAPPGKTLLQTMVYCSEKDSVGFIEQRNRDRGSYAKRKDAIAAFISEALTERFGELKDHLTKLDVWTPATYHRYVDTEIGSFMGFAFPKKRLPIKLSNRIPGIDNVLLAGQWLQMPGGLPIAALSGRDAINAIG